MTEGPEGLLLVDKPAGPTSHDVVARVRRLAGQRRVGHGGTLDPPATGLLPLVLGRATRLVRFLPASPKVYTGRLRLGLATSTDDLTGTPLREHAGALPPDERVLEEARGLTGEQLQRPPAVSARKVGGRRLYRLARRGLAVEAPASRVEVSEFALEPAGAPGEWRFRASVSAGTYVRALARDLGERLGCGGVLLELRRVSIGPLRVEDATPLERLESPDGAGPAGLVIPLEAMPLEPPTVVLRDPVAVGRFVAGTPVTLPEPEPEAGSGLRRVLDGAGALLGVAEATEGRLRPRVVLAR